MQGCALEWGIMDSNSLRFRPQNRMGTGCLRTVKLTSPFEREYLRVMARCPVSLLQKLLQCSSVIDETSSHYGVNYRRKHNKVTQNKKKTHNSEKNAQLLFFQCILILWNGYPMVKHKNESNLVFMP